SGAFEYFLNIDGIPGESDDGVHHDEIDLDSFRWGKTQPGIQRSDATSGGGNTGKARFSDISFTKKVDKASPLLMLAAADGRRLRTATLTARRPGGDDYLTMTFSDVVVSSYTTGGGSGDEPIEEITLNFGKVEMEYKPHTSPSGSPSPSIRTGWDLKTNKPL
ncbi:MAG: type VI secretion system tube protein Hcp, partial [Parcubacteria group bacterium]|nr:type VI secretion system tube protein Hcp [Parcubacteria group bacterium]